MSRRLALLAMLLSMTATTGGQERPPLKAAGFSIDVLGDLKGFELQSSTTRVGDGVEVLRLILTSAEPAQPPRVALKWRIPSHDVAGHWMTSRVLEQGDPP